MNDFSHLARVGISAVLVLGVGACGGSVDLGGERSAASHVFATSADSPKQDEHAGVAWSFTEGFEPFQLVGSGDFLYVLGFNRPGPRGVGQVRHGMAVVRCKRHSCADTAEFMNVPRAFSGMQAFDGRMGVNSTEAGLSLLASYALPDLGDEEVVISGLPSLGQEALFHEGFVYWSLQHEAGVYRCALSDCGEGPTRLESQRASGPLSVDGDALFYVSAGVIHRADTLGERLAVGLSPDERLSEVPAYDASMPPGGTYVIATAEGMLYASFQSPECLAACTWSLARWPVQGGARELLVESTRVITNVFVQGGEVAWVERREAREHAALFRCVIDSCAATRRELGTVTAASAVVTDGDAWYWLAAEDRGPDLIGMPDWSHRQLRRTPLIRTEPP